MSRNLVACCDGTWSTPDHEDYGVIAPTNVVRIYNAVSSTNDVTAQLKYYHPGVGTEKNLVDKLIGGGIGLGLDKHIMSAYKWLSDNYQTGDNIYLFGFSRGAYTARSLAGMIAHCGLLQLSPSFAESDKWRRVETAFKEGYQKRQQKINWAHDASASAKEDWQFHKSLSGTDVGVYFLGVWDTVGALGIPQDLAILSLLDNPKSYNFYDTNISHAIEHARHAVAVDEIRASFYPTLFNNATNGGGANAHPDAIEKWFPGGHGDVGGGNADKGLSDGALQWMINEAGVKGLLFDASITAQISPNTKGMLHNAVSGAFGYMRTQPRATPYLSGSPLQIDASVNDRQNCPPISQAPYRPDYLLNMAGSSKAVTIFASQHWNQTGVYLTAGEYIFTATGEWVDQSMVFSPDGTLLADPEHSNLLHKVLNFYGKLESLYKKVLNKPYADFKGTKRIEGCPWFGLVGVLANSRMTSAGGTPVPHEIIPIWQGCCAVQGFRFTVNAWHEGYLYCFANDAWGYYENNKGGVELTITRC